MELPVLRQNDGELSSTHPYRTRSRADACRRSSIRFENGSRISDLALDRGERPSVERFCLVLVVSCSFVRGSVRRLGRYEVGLGIRTLPDDRVRPRREDVSLRQAESGLGLRGRSRAERHRREARPRRRRGRQRLGSQDAELRTLVANADSVPRWPERTSGLYAASSTGSTRSRSSKRRTSSNARSQRCRSTHVSTALRTRSCACGSSESFCSRKSRTSG